MDNYQPIYDAVRSRISPCDVSEIVSQAALNGLDFSHARMMLQEQIAAAGFEYMRPSAVYRPSLYPDGNMWCALLGTDIQTGVCGFGETPDAAMREFDKAWHEKLPSAGLSAPVLRTPTPPTR